MVHVVFAKVVFGQVGDVGLLDMGNVARSQHADIHVCGMLVCIEYDQRSSMFNSTIRRCETTRSASHLPHARQVFLVGEVARVWESTTSIAPAII